MSAPPWRKPSSLAGSHGPELRLSGDGHVEIRHSSQAERLPVAWYAAFTREEFAALCAAIRKGEFDDLAACCDLHGRCCEPPSELCCRRCTEVRHPFHAPGEACSSPDLSANSLAEQAKIDAHVSAALTWHADVVDARRALEAAAEAIREDERKRVYAELGNDHFVIFTADRWTIEHSAECRLSGRMHECAVHAAVAETFWRTPDRDMHGRWRVTGIDGEGLPELERADLIGGDQ